MQRFYHHYQGKVTSMVLRAFILLLTNVFASLIQIINFVVVTLNFLLYSKHLSSLVLFNKILLREIVKKIVFITVN